MEKLTRERLAELKLERKRLVDERQLEKEIEIEKELIRKNKPMGFLEKMVRGLKKK